MVMASMKVVFVFLVTISFNGWCVVCEESANLADILQGNNSTGDVAEVDQSDMTCHQKDDAVLDERDMLLVDLVRKLEYLRPNLTEKEEDLLADLMEADGCTDDMIESAVMEYEERGRPDHSRAKRNTCSISCPKGRGSANCSGKCKCKCNFWGKAKCKCCGWLC